MSELERYLREVIDNYSKEIERLELEYAMCGNDYCDYKTIAEEIRRNTIRRDIYSYELYKLMVWEKAPSVAVTKNVYDMLMKNKQLM